MNGAHFHLMINHFPIIGTIIGTMILVAGFMLKHNIVKQTGLATLIFSSLSLAVVLLSGDPAGDAIKGLNDVSESMIEHHETIAYSTLWAAVPMGILSALSFYSLWKKEKAGNTLSLITLLLSLITIGMMTWVGITGGHIRHTELRSETTILNSNQGSEDDD